MSKIKGHVSHNMTKYKKDTYMAHKRVFSTCNSIDDPFYPPIADIGR